MSRNLFLYEDVDNKIIKDITEKIIEINETDDDKDEKEKDYKREPIKLYISSFGGDAYDGLGLIGVMEKSNTPIHTYITGKSMSMAFLIGCSGHKRYCNKYSTFMYHQGRGGARGDLNFLIEDTNELKRLMDIYDNCLLEKTKLTKHRIDEIKEKRMNWYISAEEALQLGIVDEII